MTTAAGGRSRVRFSTAGGSTTRQLPHEFSHAGVRGGFNTSSDGQLRGRIEASFLGRVQRLTEPTRLLLLAAAEPTGEITLLWRSAGEARVRPPRMPPPRGAGTVAPGPRCASGRRPPPRGRA